MIEVLMMSVQRQLHCRQQNVANVGVDFGLTESYWVRTVAQTREKMKLASQYLPFLKHLQQIKQSGRRTGKVSRLSVMWKVQVDCGT